MKKGAVRRDRDTSEPAPASGACPEFVELEELALGRTDASRKGVLDQHVSACASCRSSSTEIRANLELELTLARIFALPSDAAGRATGADLSETRGDSPGVRGHAPEIRGHAPEVSGHSPGVSGHSPGVSGHSPDIEGFRLVRELGRGGMGVVYEAEQESPGRRVALKVVRGSQYVDAATLRLFQREIRALARIEHDGIAALYDAGCTSGGEHFFAMELVRGEPITRRAAGLEREDQLGLFLALCDAIDFAHQRGVIHRDLKPSNVLVDEHGRVKVLDFGLAKITDQDVAHSTLVTEIGSIRGTLAYMSPEQARGDPSRIDLRSDVYALGAMLYELVTGRHPIDVFNVHIAEAARRICDVNPSRPSSIATAVSADLETIVLKALEKDPARRYPSASALADDLRHYLANEPISARPPSSVYQLKKLVERHKLASGLAAAIFLIAIGTAVWTSVMYERESTLRETADLERTKADRARDAADSERAKADRETELARVRALTAEKTKDFLVDVFRVSDLELGDAKDPPASTLLKKGVADIGTKLAGEPAVKAELLETFGTVYSHLGRYAEARPLLEEAVQHRRAEGVSGHTALADVLDELGLLLVSQQEAARAVSVYEEALGLRRETAGEHAPVTIDALVHYATALKESGDLPRAEEIFRSVLASLRASGAGDSDESIINTENQLAAVFMRMYKHDAAREIYERVLARARESNPRSLRLCSALNDVALAAELQGDHARAEERYLEAIALRSELVGEDNPSVAVVLVNLAYVYVGTNRTSDALEVCERARKVFERSHGEHNPAYANAVHALAGIHYMRGEAAEAEALCKQAIEIRLATLATDHPDLAESYNLLGKVLVSTKRYEEAAQAFTTAAGALERGLGRANMRAISSRTNIGACQLALKHYDEAQKTLEPAFEAMRACPDAKAADKRAVAALLVRLHDSAGRRDEAARYEALAKEFVDPPPARVP